MTFDKPKNITTQMTFGSEVGSEVSRLANATTL
jgi:hypothetical protein